VSSFRGAHGCRTICEVLREINDLHQDSTEHSVLTRKKIFEAYEMGKRMAKKLYEYNRAFDKGWWEANPDKARDLERRLNKQYLCG
jgi:hypothetical protein